MVFGVCHPPDGSHIGTAVNQCFAERIIVAVNGFSVHVLHARLLKVGVGEHVADPRDGGVKDGRSHPVAEEVAGRIDLIPVASLIDGVAGQLDLLKLRVVADSAVASVTGYKAAFWPHAVALPARPASGAYPGSGLIAYPVPLVSHLHIHHLCYVPVHSSLLNRFS